MRPIRRGDRGPAVEDVQRRLRVLGADLGPTGVDGVFLGATLSAVLAFQVERGLDEDGTVGPETWAALVDATFTLGDRLLYLRLPYLHGADVRTLQGALNALGFAAGEPDGIFGQFAERAVREFEVNTGLPADGIVGPEVVRALEHLRHVWGDKEPQAPDALRRAPARSAGALAGVRIAVVPLDATGRLVATRLENLARASTPGALLEVAERDAAVGARLVMRVGRDAGQPSGDVPIVAAGDGGDLLARRVEASLRSGPSVPEAVDVVVQTSPDDEHGLQRIAVGLLDGLCAGLAGAARPVVT
ncbi:MAG TPA: peptidoglycan-binding protein [Coriobacteriia bacterium]